MTAPLSNSLTIKKRDGRVVAFDRTKIVAAIMKAAHSVQGSDYRLAEDLADQVIAALQRSVSPADLSPGVEQIQDAIEKVLIENGHARTAKAFILYRAERSRVREQKSELMEWLGQALTHENTLPTKHHAVGKAITAEFVLRRLLAQNEAEMHSQGDWHIHGLSDYAQTPHSALVPLRPALLGGLRHAQGTLPPAQRAHDLAAITTAVVLGTAAEVHGGVAIPHFDSLWASAAPTNCTEDELQRALETLLHDLNMVSPAAWPEPFHASFQVGMDAGPVARGITKTLLNAVLAGAGAGPLMRPHLVYSLKEGVNLRPGDPNFDLTETALQISQHRGGIDFLYDCPLHAVIAGQACLPTRPADAPHIALAGRLSLNVPRLALRARRQGFETADLLRELLTQAAQHLHRRAQTIAQRPVSALRFLSGDFLPHADRNLTNARWQQFWECPRVAINLVGLAETLMVLSGQHHGASPSAQAEGLNLIKAADARVAELNREFNLEIILQGTPAQAAAQRFARMDRREFGIIRGVTDRDHYATGVHIPSEGPGHRSAEAAYQGDLPGGCPCDYPFPASAENGLRALHEGIQAGLRWLRFPGNA